jgi:hypothetical protein
MARSPGATPLGAVGKGRGGPPQELNSETDRGSVALTPMAGNDVPGFAA